MCTLATLNLGSVIESRVKRGDSHKKISLYLKASYPGIRGLSRRSVRRFCENHTIHYSSRLPDPGLDVLLRWSTGKVGPTYGRKMMKGFLKTRGFNISQQRIGAALHRVDPTHHTARRILTTRSVNPQRYRAKYFGHKCHLDQNEKIVMYGATHVCAIDGFSGKIIAMPIKSNQIIYDRVYRNITISYGVFDEIHVDHGQEWNLLLFVNSFLESYRACRDKPPHVQVSSKKNHTIERIWVEVNSRVNYPLKRILIQMEESGHLNLENSMHQFASSWITLQTANVGVKMFISSWNEHPIPSRRNGPKGIPNNRMNSNYKAVKIPSSILPEVSIATKLYQANGGSLSSPGVFGVDPLSAHQDKIEIRNKAVLSKFSFENIFSAAVNKNGQPFVAAFQYFVDVTHRLSYTSL